MHLLCIVKRVVGLHIPGVAGGLLAVWWWSEYAIGGKVSMHTVLAFVADGLVMLPLCLHDVKVLQCGLVSF